MELENIEKLLKFHKEEVKRLNEELYFHKSKIDNLEIKRNIEVQKNYGQIIMEV